jgi:type I pantothenate kinase
MKRPDNRMIHWQELLERLHERFRHKQNAGAYVVGITGGVAAGKTTFSEMLCKEMKVWPERPGVEIVSTDGFLFPNKALAERQLSTRKGFPESYDTAALAETIARLRQGTPVKVPLYSHVTYDVDPNAWQEIHRADIAIIDGLHLGRMKSDSSGHCVIDLLFYLDAEEADIELWFRNRLFPLMVAGRTDPNSFYYAFRNMDDAAALEFVDRVWTGINLPNLREHIVLDRACADAVVRKARDHSIEAIAWRGE